MECGLTIKDFIDYKGDIIEIFQIVTVDERVIMKKNNQSFTQRQLKAGENLKKILARSFIQPEYYITRN